jgi:Kelch motif
MRRPSEAAPQCELLCRSIPHAVGGPGFALIAHHLYIAGGRDAANATLNLTWGYQIATNTWTGEAPMPQPTNVPGSGTTFGRFFIWGGGNPFIAEPRASASTYAYDPAVNSWSRSVR